MTRMNSVESLDLYEVQFTRYIMYRSHIEFLDQELQRADKVKIRAIEFGGSNRVILNMFPNATYELAPNYPVVDIHDLCTYSSEAYDYVILDEILEHVMRPWVAIGEIRRILKPGGCVITSSPFLIPIHRCPEDYWRISEAGYKVLLSEFSKVITHSWGNVGVYNIVRDNLMISTREALDNKGGSLENDKRHPATVWAYAWK